MLKAIVAWIFTWIFQKLIMKYIWGFALKVIKKIVDWIFKPKPKKNGRGIVWRLIDLVVRLAKWIRDIFRRRR
ncbi:MAG: hypothetical protein U9Q03_03555 [Patescibacteria group bacterium]|nr:hypothetical protein [Patescibacteria group bacterium]